MRRKCLFSWPANSLLCSLTLSAVFCAGVRSDDLQAGGSLLHSTGWVKFHVVFGRLKVVPGQPRIHQQVQRADPSGMRDESLAVDVQHGATEAYYLLDSPQERVSLECQATGQLLFRCEQKQGPRRIVELRQPASGPLRLVVETDSRRVFETDDLWSLALVEPEMCDNYLAPALQRALPALRVTEMRGQVVSELFRLSRESRPCRQRVEELVGELGAKRYSTRQHAEADLKSLGPGVLPYIQQIPERHLDAEQRQRIERIRRHYHVNAPDCCERVAAWLASRPTTWLALMRDEEPMRRKLAYAALCASCGEQRTLEFHPSGDHDLRRRQLDKLHSQLATN